MKLRQWGLVACAVWCSVSAHALSDKGFDSLKVFSRVLHDITEHYVDAIDEEALVWAAVQGMMDALDPHTAFLTPRLYKSLQSDTSGEFGGIGAELTLRRGWLTVIAPIDDTPAARAGLRAGDRIIKINGVSTKAMPPSEAVGKMRGRPGSSVALTIVRGKSGTPFTVSLKREHVKFPSVRWAWLEPGYGYVRVTSFQENTLGDFKVALQKAGAETPLQGLVIDLRNNPGGLLDQAVGMVDLFLEDGVILTTVSRGKEISRHEATRDGNEATYPVVILVNGGSASAAEIVSGAMQDRARAVLVGSQTFGKGSVQTVIPMDDGSALKLTIARYYTPSKRSIQAHGIAPDLVVAEESDDTPKKTEAALKRHLGDRRGKDPGNTRGRVRLAMPVITMQPGDEDRQRAVALSLLKSGAVSRATSAP